MFSLWNSIYGLPHHGDAQPTAGTFGAHSFKIVNAKQKLAATIIKASQHYSERTQRWSSCSLQAPMLWSGVTASGSHSLSAKQDRDKGTGKLTREREDMLLLTDSKFLSRKGLFHLSQLLVCEMLLLSAPWHTHYSSLCYPPINPPKRKYFLHLESVIKWPWCKATFPYDLSCFYPDMPLKLYLKGRNERSILCFCAGEQILPGKQQWALRCETLPVQTVICEYYRITLF